MDKIKIITKTIFGEEDLWKIQFPMNDEVKQNFEIAWDICEIFEEYIRKPIRKKVANELYNKLKKNFENYEIRNGGFLEGEKYGGLCIFPKDWLLNEKDRPVLSYGLGWDRYNYYDLYYGIAKKDENNPYQGEFPEDFKELIKIQEDLKRNNFSISKHWLVWKWFKEPFRGMWQREFYHKLFNNFEGVISYYINEIEDLINMTKKDIDQFIVNFVRK